MREIYNGPTPVDRYADLHMHTTQSDGLMEPAQLLERALNSGRIHTIAGTDHEVIGPSVLLRNESERRGYPLEVMVGTELTTNAGHIVALDLNNDIVSGKSPEWTIQQIHTQGGLAIAAHPLSRGTRSLTERTILRIVANPDPQVYFDGFEVFNAGLHTITDIANIPLIRRIIGADKALLFYVAFLQEQPQLAWKLGAPIGCTDGHFNTVGRGLTGYQGDLRIAMQRRETTVFTLDMPEQLTLMDIAKQLYSSMVVENFRRSIRYGLRSLMERSKLHGGK